MKLEGQPRDEQKARLEDWLTDLMLICRRHRIVPITEDGETSILDLSSSTIIGLGLVPLVGNATTGPGRITAVDCEGSILDGVWLVDSPRGPQEARDLGPVWPRRPQEDQPR